MHTQTAPDPIADLWSAARALFERMRAHIGEAEAIAALRLDRDTLAAMRAWLRPLEALVRRIVLIEAAALARTPLAPKRQSERHAQAPQAKPPRQRSYALRLWARTPPAPARIRQLGPPLLVRDIYRERARAAQARRLNMVRFMRPPEPLRIARRIEALARVLEKPANAVRRLARKLRQLPKLAIKLAAARWPRSPHTDHAAQNIASGKSYWGAVALIDSS